MQGAHDRQPYKTVSLQMTRRQGFPRAQLENAFTDLTSAKLPRETSLWTRFEESLITNKIILKIFSETKKVQGGGQ